MLVKVLAVFIVFLMMLSQTAFVINEWEQAVVLQFGETKRKIEKPGLYFKYPMVQDLHRFDKWILVTDARPAEYITLDKKRLIVDTVSRWRITNPLLFFQTVGDYRGATARLNDTIVGRLRQEVANHNFKDFIREERESIMDLVTKGTAEAATSFGIKVVDVRIRRVDLPDEVQASVFARMKAERERIAKRYRAEGEEAAKEIRAGAAKEQQIILAEAYRQREVLMGEGDAEATSIYASAYGRDVEFYSFMRRLEVYEKVFPKGTTVLLQPKSDLLRFFESSKAPEPR